MSESSIRTKISQIADLSYPDTAKVIILNRKEREYLDTDHTFISNVKEYQFYLVLYSPSSLDTDTLEESLIVNQIRVLDVTEKYDNSNFTRILKLSITGD